MTSDVYARINAQRRSRLNACRERRCPGCVSCREIERVFAADTQHWLDGIAKKQDDAAMTEMHRLLWEKYPDNVERTMKVLSLVKEARQAGVPLADMVKQMKSW
jgi:hypothetical protein